MVAGRVAAPGGWGYAPVGRGYQAYGTAARSGRYLLVLRGQDGRLFNLSRLHFLGFLPSIALRFDSTLFVGIPTIIVTFVMEEARRIAADNAEII